MAIQEHLKILVAAVKSGDVAVWNSWRDDNPGVQPDLTHAVLGPADFAHFFGDDRSLLPLNGVDLHGADLRGAQLIGASLRGANLHNAKCTHAYFQNADLSQASLNRAECGRANFFRADLRGADLSSARLEHADLTDANLCGANLREANLMSAHLVRANLSDADLTEALLGMATLVETNLANARLTRCWVYGVSAWNLDVTKIGDQTNLRITQHGEPEVAVDNLAVAQFVHLLLHNPNIRDIVGTIGQKGVLILGRFTPERKAVLEAIRTKLRELGYVPIMFDFERPTQRDFTETIKVLAGLSRFIIADITNPRSSPLELQATMPEYMIPFVPIIHEDEEPFSMFRDLQEKHEWVLDVLEYDSAANLIAVLDSAVVRPALQKADQLLARRTQAIRKRHVADYP